MFNVSSRFDIYTNIIWDNDARCCVLDFLDWTPTSPITSEWRSQGTNHAEKFPKWAGGDTREGNFGGVFARFDCDVLPVWLSACGVSFIFPQRCPRTDPPLHQHNTPTKKVCSSCLLRRDPSVPVGQQQTLSFSLSSLPPLSWENNPCPQAEQSGMYCTTVNLTQLQQFCNNGSVFTAWIKVGKKNSSVFAAAKGAVR